MGKFDFDDTNSTGIWWSTNVAIKDELIGLKDDTNSTGIWWSTNVAIKDELIGLKNDTNCDDSELVELLRSIAQKIEDYGL